MQAGRSVEPDLEDIMARGRDLSGTIDPSA
jgi:hypothetical protein